MEARKNAAARGLAGNKTATAAVGEGGRSIEVGLPDGPCSIRIVTADGKVITIDTVADPVDPGTCDAVVVHHANSPAGDGSLQAILSKAGARPVFDTRVMDRPVTEVRIALSAHDHGIHGPTPTQGEIDDRTDEWHREPSGMELHQALGMTTTEFGRFIEDPADVPMRPLPPFPPATRGHG